MGAAVSNQVSKQIINNSYSIANQVVTNCQSSTQNNTNLNFSGNCKFTSQEVDITQNNTVSASCVQNATVQNSLQSQINAQIISQVNAAAQSLGGPSLSLANSTSEFAQRASLDIKNQFTVNCVNQQNNTANFNCSDNADVNVSVLRIGQDNKSYNSCTNDATIKNGLIAELANIIQATTSAEEANTLAGALVIILIVLAIVAIFYVQTLNGPIGWLIVGIVAIIIIGLIFYAVYAFKNGLYPFTKS